MQLLKEEQKKKAIADLETQQKQSLSNLDAEMNQIKPAYYAKKNSTNVQSQVSSKNFAEYLANTGRSNSGIGAQYEMARKNNLQSSLNALNIEEANAIADINKRKTDINNNYQTGLASANAQIEADYITNLLSQRQQAWEREMQEKQYQESIRQYNEQMAYQREQDAITNAQTWAKINSSKDELGFDDPVIETDYYTGAINSDAQYGTFATTDKNGTQYQPNNVSGNRLSNRGYKVSDIFADSAYGTTGADLSNQKIWKTSDGKYYVWDGSINNYIDVTEKVNKSVNQKVSIKW